MAANGSTRKAPRVLVLIPLGGLAFLAGLGVASQGGDAADLGGILVLAGIGLVILGVVAGRRSWDPRGPA